MGFSPRSGNCARRAARLALAVALAAGLVLADVSAPASAQRTQAQPVRRLGDRWFVVATGATSWRVPYFGTGDLAAAHPSVVRAVILVDGTLRDAHRYYATALSAGRAAGVDPRRVAIVVPQFLATPDAAALALPADVPYWSLEGWKDGAAARGSAGALSSFAVLDALLQTLGDRRRFPALADVVVAGHSAGAQLVQRYAALGRLAGAQRAGLAIRYVVADPSSYLYFDNRRLSADGSFLPYPRGLCPGANQYKYGLDGAPPYAGTIDGVTLARKYAARDVTYLLGGADVDPHAPFLDRTCAAEAQGASRLERGERYIRALRLIVGTAPFNQVLCVLPGIGHEARVLFSSACGARVLFVGGGGC